MRPATGEKPGAQTRVRHSCLRPAFLARVRHSSPAFGISARARVRPETGASPWHVQRIRTAFSWGRPKSTASPPDVWHACTGIMDPRIDGDSGHIPPFRASEAAEHPTGPGLSKTQGQAHRLPCRQEEPGLTGFKVYQFRLPQPGKTPTRRTERPRPGESSPSPAFPKTPPEGRSPPPFRGEHDENADRRAAKDQKNGL